MRLYRLGALLPAILALPSLLQNIIPLPHVMDSLLMTPATAFGLIASSLVWFFYFLRNRYSLPVLMVHGIISVPLTAVTIIGYVTHNTLSFTNSFVPKDHASFMLNLAITFSASYVIQILYRWLPRTTLYINGLIAVILFVAILSVSGHLYSLDKIVSAQLLMPIPPTAILGFIILSLTIFFDVNRMEHLYLNKKIILSFLLMLVAIVGANAVVYRNFNDTIGISSRIETTRKTIGEVYSVDLLLDSISTNAQSYEQNGQATYAVAYQKSLHNYYTLIEQAKADAQKTRNKDIYDSVMSVSRLGDHIIVSTDLAISRQHDQNTPASTARTSSDVILDGYMDRLLDTITHINTIYTNQINELVVRQAYSNRGIITGVSITSALSILLIIFTPLFIRQTIRTLSITQDHLKKSYKQLSEQKGRADAILTSIGDGIFAVDPNSRVTLFNQAAVEISGLQAVDVVGKEFTKALHFSADDGNKSVLDFVSKALAGTQMQVTHNVSLKHKAGKKIEVQITASPIKDHTSEVIGAIVVFRDRTSEQALENAKDEFVSLASHQLRTPATATKQFLAMFLQGYAGKIDDRQRMFLQEAYDNNELGINIIEELLNIARLESNQVQVKKELVNFSELMMKAADVHTATAEKNKQTIKLDLPKEPVFVYADTSLLSMVLDNLITNALKYTLENGTVTLQLRRNAHTVTARISDTGIGIKKENIPKIFGRFSRLEDPSKQHVSGTGIGLYLVQKIIDMHHAKIQVESEYGKGSTFIVDFNDDENKG